jgi:hypothetical protein
MIWMMMMMMIFPVITIFRLVSNHVHVIVSHPIQFQSIKKQQKNQKITQRTKEKQQS